MFCSLGTEQKRTSFFRKLPVRSLHTVFVALIVSQPVTFVKGKITKNNKKFLRAGSPPIYYFKSWKNVEVMLLVLGAAARGAVPMAGRTDGCRQQVGADNTPFLSKAQLSPKDAFLRLCLQTGKACAQLTRPMQGRPARAGARRRPGADAAYCFPYFFDVHQRNMRCV